MAIICRVCKESKEGAKGQSGSICHPCLATYNRAYKAKNRDRVKAYWQKRREIQNADPEWVAKNRKRTRDYWKNLRLEIMMAYGGLICACCGETEPKFFSIDHIFNDGAEHRRSFGYDANGKGADTRVIAWIKANNFPGGFQVLCMNCNHGKARNGGICPHKTSKANSVKTGEAQTG